MMQLNYGLAGSTAIRMTRDWEDWPLMRIQHGRRKSMQWESWQMKRDGKRLDDTKFAGDVTKCKVRRLQDAVCNFRR
jgi:hypothetical protein